MLAGFNSDGKPIVHDPAKSNGYSFVYNKTSISQSWFNKGGVAYTFYPEGSYPTSVENHLENYIVDEFTLYQNYPNPFNPSTKISWQSPVGSHQTLKIYDVLGNEVATLVDEFRNAGSYEVEFNLAQSSAADLPAFSSGVYFYQLKAGDYVETKKMILLK